MDDLVRNLKKDLAGLNPQQLEAVKSTENFVEIVAGAGTGKTHTIVCRAEYLVVEKNVDPANILMITFTRKAANEMRERIGRTLGSGAAERMKICTFHVFCNTYLKKYASVLGFSNDYKILKPVDQKEMMTDAWGVPHRDARLAFEKKGGRNFEKQGGFPSVSNLLKIYGDARNKDITVYDSVLAFFDEHSALNDDYIDAAVDIIKAFNKQKADEGYIDYDDMLWYMRYLLLNYERIRAKLDAHYEYIMCDEYQDTNIVQDAILDLLTKNVPNLCVIGDENQAIYSFRGADIRNILSFGERHMHRGFKKIVLFENYRSSQEILNVANSVINRASYCPNVALHGQFSMGKLPNLLYYPTDEGVDSAVLDYVKRDLAAGVKPNDIAIVGRTANSTNGVELTLRRAGIPFKKYGGLSFFEREHIITVLSLMKAAYRVDYGFDWRRALRTCEGIGDELAKRIYDVVLEKGVKVLDLNNMSGLKSITRLPRKAYIGLDALYDFIKRSQGVSPSVCADYASVIYHNYVLERIKNTNDVGQAEKLRARLENADEDIADLIALASEYSDFDSMFTDLDLSASIDDVKQPSEECVVVTTVHSAKGLEYHSVYLVGAVEGIFPGYTKTEDELDEEVRCMYVALTRAKRTLMILVPKRMVRGALVGKPCDLSSLLDDISVLRNMDVHLSAGCGTYSSGYGGYNSGYRSSYGGRRRTSGSYGGWY